MTFQWHIEKVENTKNQIDQIFLGPFDKIPVVCGSAQLSFNFYIACSYYSQNYYNSPICKHIKAGLYWYSSNILVLNL